jgi:hypothetical protein
MPTNIQKLIRVKERELLSNANFDSLTGDLSPQFSFHIKISCRFTYQPCTLCFLAKQKPQIMIRNVQIKVLSDAAISICLITSILPV